MKDKIKVLEIQKLRQIYSQPTSPKTRRVHQLKC